MRRVETVSIAELVREFINKNNLANGLDEARMPEIWKDVAGSYVFNATKSLSVSNNKLFLSINSAIIRNEIMLIKSELIKRINDKTGHHFIRDIIIR